MLMTIDLLPTIAKRVNAKLPPHRIDGLDVWPIISGQPGARNPHAAYWFYYEVNELQAVVSGDGRWKLQLPHTYRTLAGQPGGHDGFAVPYEHRTLQRAELYDLLNDIWEQNDVSRKHADIVQRLALQAEHAREELGDALIERKGNSVRQPGKLK